MRTSTVFASFIALAASAPLNMPTLPVGDLPSAPETGATSVPEFGDLPVDLPAKRHDLPEFPELEDFDLPGLPLKRATVNVGDLVEGVNVGVNTKRAVVSVDDLVNLDLGVDGVAEDINADANTRRAVVSVDDLVNLDLGIDGVDEDINTDANTRRAVVSVDDLVNLDLGVDGVDEDINADANTKRAVVSVDDLVNLDLGVDGVDEDINADANTRRAVVSVDDLVNLDLGIDGVDEDINADANTKRATIGADAINIADVSANVASKRSVDADASATIQQAIDMLTAMANAPEMPEPPVKRTNVVANAAGTDLDAAVDVVDATVATRQVDGLFFVIDMLAGLLD